MAPETALDPALDVLLDADGWRFLGIQHESAPRHPAEPGSHLTVVPVLLDDVCRTVGFCLRPAQRARLVRDAPGDPVAFTEALFAAVGLDPRLMPRLRSEVLALAEAHLSVRSGARATH